MKFIKKVKLHNYRRFSDFSVNLDEKLNIFVGENEAGKSSILSAINLVLSGSKSQFEKTGLEKLMNTRAVKEFIASEKKYENLPIFYVELWLNEQNNFKLNGNQNSEKLISDGLRMECVPNDEFSSEINEILEVEGTYFPYEFYTVKFSTFSGERYSGYRQFLNHIVIDTAQIGNEYSIREYVGDMYKTYVSSSEKNKLEFAYRKRKEDFKQVEFSKLNDRVKGYNFAVKSDVRANLQTDITLLEEDIGIDNKGRGKQCFIKTEFALKKAEGVRNKLDIALIEEPENHLSHINMKRLIKLIDATEDKQLLIATHSNFISSRLDLRKLIMLHTSSNSPAHLSQLSEDTAKFFIKAPDNGVLNFILSKKIILVEGNAEFMLMEKFYKSTKGGSVEDAEIYIMSVGGLSFKRYLEIAKLLGIQVAVIRDNDGDHKSKCIDAYKDYEDSKIKIFFDTNDERKTFEICLYQDNKILCDKIFSSPNRKLDIQEYLLKNKTEGAFKLLDNSIEISVPSYIKSAIEWVSS